MIFQRAALASAFQTVSGVVPTRTPKPVLQNVKLLASLGEATLMGTDQEVGIRCKLTDVDVQRGGEVLLPTNRVLAMLRELHGDGVVMEASEQRVTIKGDQAEFTLPVEDPAEYPTVAEFAGEDYFVVPAGLFKQMIKRTAFATDPESTRYALGGVLMDLSGDSLSLVATDTRRLALSEGKCSKKGNATAGMAAPVIPTKALSLIERSVTDDAAEVRFVIKTNDVLIGIGGSTIYSRLVEGRYPRYRDVIPTGGKVKIELTAGPFYSAVRQAQIVTSEESRGVIFTFAPGLITLHSSAADVGQSKVELPVSYDGPEVKINFDPRFVADFLKVLEPEQSLTVDMIDSESAAAFRTQDGYTYIVMPLSMDR
jgi:DNA polymerase-3 subunit beta